MEGGKWEDIYSTVNNKFLKKIRPMVLSSCRILRNINILFILSPDLDLILTMDLVFSDTGFGTTSGGGAFGTSAFGSSNNTGGLFGNSQTKPGRGFMWNRVDLFIADIGLHKVALICLYNFFYPLPSPRRIIWFQFI